MEEIWKPIPKYENLYEVSNLGRVRSLDRQVKCRIGFRLHRGKILTPIDMGKDYLIVNLSKNNKTEIHPIIKRKTWKNVI